MYSYSFVKGAVVRNTTRLIFLVPLGPFLSPELITHESAKDWYTIEAHDCFSALMLNHQGQLPRVT